MLYTGDSVGTGGGDRWSIDLTVGRIGGRDYAVWSGWAQNAATDKTPQQLYIAPMENPWTIAANRVLLSAPDAQWERGPELDLQEGPELLYHGREVFVIYSTRDSWLREYALGQLRLRDSDADPLDPRNWTKSGPVFTGSAATFGVGHASFVTTPGEAEQWIVYHSKDQRRRAGSAACGCNVSSGRPTARRTSAPLPAPESASRCRAATAASDSTR